MTGSRRERSARSPSGPDANRRPAHAASEGFPAAFAVVLLTFLPYAAWFIWNTSFVVEGTRYFCLSDDAMISMTYARNAALGQGWVWNPGGEPVEGYTNPLWTLFMTLVHFLPVDESKLSLVIQLACVLCLAANLWFVQRLIARFTDGSRGFTIAAMLLTAFYYPLNMWSLLGMEVAPLALLTTAIAWCAVRCLDEERFLARTYLLMVAGVLTRMDMVVVCGVTWAFLAWCDRPRRMRHLRAGIASIGGTLALLTVWRWRLYGDLLPNTYYLKMQGYPAVPRIATGLMNYVNVVHQQNLLLFLLPFAALAVARRRGTLLAVAIFVAQSAYSIYVGGDAWEWFGGANRYVTIVMPIFVVLLTAAGWELRRRLDDLHLTRAGELALGAVAFLLVLFSLNTADGLRSLERPVFLEAPLNVDHHPEMVGLALQLQRITTPEARVAVVWAGIIPYFSRRFAIDVLGKSDRYVAHLPMHNSHDPEWGYFYPGHLKWDYAHSIERLAADVVAHAWPSWDEVTPFLDGFAEHRKRDGDPYYLRIGSPRIVWQRVARLGDAAE